jgi:proteasome assembly chaperone (PAC2) family protein
MEHLRWLPGVDEITLTNPVVVAAFTGWNDAGDAASTAVRTMIESSGATALAEIDPEPFTDFATVRPHVRLDEQRSRSIVWPTVGVWGATTPGTDVVLILGPEPALRWRTFCEQIVGVADRLGARSGFTLGALLADVPHTRRTQVIATATDPDLMDRFDLEPSRYEGPTGIVGVLHDACVRAELDAVSFWVHVPHYANNPPCPKATLALLHRVEELLDLPVPMSELAEESAQWEERLRTAADQDAELAEYVRELEERAGEDMTQLSGDEIAQQFERYLRRRGGSTGPTAGR